MQIEVRKSGGEVCLECGATPLICVMRDPQHDYEEVRRTLNTALELEPRWYRPFKRRWAETVKERFAEIEADLLESTKYPVVEPIWEKPLNA